MPPEREATVPPLPPATVPAARLDYAPAVSGRGWRRWRARGLVALAIGAAAALAWYGWQWRLKQDEMAFNARATIGPVSGWVEFNAPPTPAALRHLQRLPNIRALGFRWSGNPDPAAYLGLRGRRFPTVTTVQLYGGMDANGWVKELARPDTGLKALTTLYLYGTQVTDAGLRELGRPDSGLKALATLYLRNTNVTDAGVAALKAARPGLKVFNSPAR